MKLRLFLMVSVLIVGMAPLTFALNETSRVCVDGALSPDTQTINLYFRTSPTGPETVRSVPRGLWGLDPRVDPQPHCAATQISVAFGMISPALPDNATYYLKATAVDMEGHESARSAEVVPSPFPLDTQAPPAPVGLEAK